MMAASEVEPLREARSKRRAAEEATRAAKVEAEEARRKQREASRRQAEQEVVVPQSQPKYNPYLAHMGNADGADDDE